MLEEGGTVNTNPVPQEKVGKKTEEERETGINKGVKSRDFEEREESEEDTRSGNVTSMMVTDKMIDILILLEKKTSATKKRIERIEAGINELYKKKKSEVTKKREASRGRVGPSAFKCTLLRALVKLGIFGFCYQ